jgi:acyl carrier protein
MVVRKFLVYLSLPLKTPLAVSSIGNAGLASSTGLAPIARIGFIAKLRHQIILQLLAASHRRMDMDHLITTIASTFGIDVSQVQEESSSRTIEQWDSLGHINLIMALEERFKLSFTVDEIMSMHDVSTIRKVLRGKISQ